MKPSMQDRCQLSVGQTPSLGPPAEFHLAKDLTCGAQSIPRTFLDAPPLAPSLGPHIPDPGSPVTGPGSDSTCGIVSDITLSSQPSTHSLSSWNSDQINTSFYHWTEAKEKVVTGPYDYIAAKPGKEIRSSLLACFNEWLEVPLERMAVINRAVRTLHTGSLLIDDIQDNSELRRGRPVAHKIFGTALTINSANYVYFLALQELSVLENPEAIRVFTTEMLRLHQGQAMDLYWRDTLTCPTEEDYFEMIANKTGGLFRLGYKLMKTESTVSIDLLPVVELLGILFQVADDYKNLCSQEYSELKGIGEDLTEGKFSFPVIHSIRSDPTDLKLLHILQQRPTDDYVKRYAIELLESTGSLNYTKQVIEKLVMQAHKAIQLADQGRGRGKGMLELLEKITKLL